MYPLRWLRLLVNLLALPIFLLLAACTGSQQNTALQVDAPDFTLTNAAGGETSLTDFSGKPVLLFFHMAVG